MTVSDDQLVPLLATWVPEQRWFAGKGRAVAFSARRLATLSSASPEVLICLVTATYESAVPAPVAPPSEVADADPEPLTPIADVETYQVPLVLYPSAVEHLQHALLGALPAPDVAPAPVVSSQDGSAPAGEPPTLFVYDALQDRDVTQLWLLGVRDQAAVDGVVFERFTDDELPLDEPSLALTGEQSNTSLVYGGSAILKVFRRLELGVNPDIEVHRALTALGPRHIAPLFGSVTADVDGVATSLAMLQDFMRTATDGWELAKTSVRDLMAEADLHAEEAGGDFAGEAERLGAAVAAVHIDLAEAFGTAALSGDDLAALAHGMHARLDSALNSVPQLADVEAGLRSTFDAFTGAAQGGLQLATQRIHGDLHLGQALRTAQRWIILDFEGEPAATLAQRRRFDSPLRDLAGMLRSFDYAARYQLVDALQVSQLEYRASEWAQRNRAAFCAGYAEAAGHDPREQEALMRGYEADKAVYEAVYETRNRPAWLAVPLASLARLVAA